MSAYTELQPASSIRYTSQGVIFISQHFMKWSNLWPYTKNQSWLVEPESQILVNSTFCAGIFCNFSSEVLPYGRPITQYISRCNYLPWHQPIPPITYVEDWFKHVLSSEPSCSHQFWIQSPWCQWSPTRGSCTTGGTSALRQEVKRNKYVYIYICFHLLNQLSHLNTT